MTVYAGVTTRIFHHRQRCFQEATSEQLTVAAVAQIFVLSKVTTEIGTKRFEKVAWYMCDENYQKYFLTSYLSKIDQVRRAPATSAITRDAELYHTI